VSLPTQLSCSHGRFRSTLGRVKPLSCPHRSPVSPAPHQEPPARLRYLPNRLSRDYDRAAPSSSAKAPRQSPLCPNAARGRYRFQNWHPHRLVNPSTAEYSRRMPIQPSRTRPAAYPLRLQNQSPRACDGREHALRTTRRARYATRQPQPFPQASAERLLGLPVQTFFHGKATFSETPDRACASKVTREPLPG